ncbi:MAG: hypothetical protein J3K34DRAFT_423260 [Monoraphidium minutum]|nr:MAG: hypothetical protein J3K34DRAFT_423260 [Monoraphidium minutum]
MITRSCNQSAARVPAARPAAPHAQRPQRRGALVARAAAAEAPPASAAALKAELLSTAGSNYGHDLDAAARSKVEALAGQLGALGHSAPSVVAGETWRPVYNNSVGNSSGKIKAGPLEIVTDVEQVFPSDEPGCYYNISRLGLVTAALKGVCGVSASNPTRVDLEFKEVALKVGPFQLAKKTWEPGQMRGHWAATYWDADLRVFTTNKGSLFIMRREA